MPPLIPRPTGNSITALTSSLTSLRLTTRQFTTSPALATKTMSLSKIPADSVPAYPYGPRLLYKQSNTGLYGTARIRFGHNVSERNKIKTPRYWRPNIHRKRLWSESLGAFVRTRLTVRVLRTIRKEGGIDNYVLKTKPARIKELGPGGWRLRWLIMQTADVRGRMESEWEVLGVDGEMGPDNTDLVGVMVDAATPGPLSAVSRRILEERAAKMLAEHEFALGEEAEGDSLAELMAGEEEDGVVMTQDIDEIIGKANGEKRDQ